MNQTEHNEVVHTITYNTTQHYICINFNRSHVNLNYRNSEMHFHNIYRYIISLKQLQFDEVFV